MGDRNHLLFVERFRAEFRGPFLEVGSRNYGTTQDLRGLFPGEVYVGVDRSGGDGVDRVVDLTRPFEEVDAALQGQRFRTVFCLSVLEHCEQPFQMAENIVRLLEPDGRVHVSAPFTWRFHGYPSDYWRFTHEGVRKLFPALEFEDRLCLYRTDVVGDFRPIDTDLGRLQVRGSWHRRRGRFLAGVTADLLRVVGGWGPLRWLTRYRDLFPPVEVEMIGRLREPARPAEP